MLGVMASYSITVKELKLLFSMLRGENGIWVSCGRRPAIFASALELSFTIICLWRHLKLNVFLMLMEHFF